MLTDQIAEISSSFPIMDVLSAHVRHQGVLPGARIGWHCHLTALTAMAVKVLVDNDCAVALSECNPDTTCGESVKYMEELGARVYCGGKSVSSVIASKPEVISDTGFVLIPQLLDEGHQNIAGACEITTSGVTKLRQLTDLPWPVVNINHGRIKTRIENFHGVGDGLVDVLRQISPVMWAGRAACVVGYGPVGAGCAEYLRRLGMIVFVCECDPVQSLMAHYDGFPARNLSECLSAVDLMVTATGKPGLLCASNWQLARDGLLVVNVGHRPDELNLADLRSLATAVERVSAHHDRYLLPGNPDSAKPAFQMSGIHAQGSPGQGQYAKERRVYVATAGSPANVVMLAGSPEPTLIHLTTEILCLEFLLRNFRAGSLLTAGEMPVPGYVESNAAMLALAALASVQGLNKSIEQQSFLLN